jgi:hypothetical protein
MMQATPITEVLQKWEKVINLASYAPVKGELRKRTLARVLENMQQEKVATSMVQLHEDAPVNNISASAGIDKYDPILISLVRRSLPNLMAYDIAGVQPMTGPTGLVFSLKSRYTSKSGTEALFNEADTDFSGTGTHAGSNPTSGTFTTGTGMATADAENLGTTVGTPGGAFGQMAFSIEKTTVEAKTRALMGEYTIELAQDIKTVHGLDADSELANILSQELLAEINRELVRTIYKVAKPGAQNCSSAGTFDLDVDSNGRWSVERFKGMLFQIERDANVIAQETRRGKGNFLVVSSDVGSALAMSGKLDYAPALNTDLNIDDTGNTFAGVLNGRYKVFVDPYVANLGAASQFCLVGYKGANAYDAGVYYCPYVPLQMIRGQDQGSLQPKIAFKTRYGLIANPFVLKADGTTDGVTFTANRNHYFRRIAVTNIG